MEVATHQNDGATEAGESPSHGRRRHNRDGSPRKRINPPPNRHEEPDTRPRRNSSLQTTSHQVTHGCWPRCPSLARCVGKSENPLFVLRISASAVPLKPRFGSREN